MKYMLLIYDNAQTRETFLGEQGRDLMAEVDALMTELTESGELVGGEALADPSNTQDGAGARRRRRRSPTGRSSRPRSSSPATTSSTARAVERAVEIAAPLARRPVHRRSRCGRSWAAGGAEM